MPWNKNTKSPLQEASLYTTIDEDRVTTFPTRIEHIACIHLSLGFTYHIDPIIAKIHEYAMPAKITAPKPTCNKRYRHDRLFPEYTIGNRVEKTGTHYFQGGYHVEGFERVFQQDAAIGSPCHRGQRREG